MSLDSIVLCPPCLSLSLLFCLDLCLSRGAASSRPAPTHIGEGGGGSTAPTRIGEGGEGRPLQEGGVVPLFSGVFSSARIFFGGVFFKTLSRALARGFLCAARGEHPRCSSRFWARSLEGLQGVGGTIVVLSDVGSFLLLGPSILTAGRDGHGHLRGQSCPPNSGSSSEDVRCSDRDRDGHDSGNSVVPSSTPGPQVDRGATTGRWRDHRDPLAESSRAES